MTDYSSEREKAVRAALAGVIDPELRRPITELNMVKSVAVAEDGAVVVEIYMTTGACPKKTEITAFFCAAAAVFAILAAGLSLLWFNRIL